MAWLRAIQLAARLEDPSAVRLHWEHAVTGLEGVEAGDTGVSSLLAGGLVALPFLEEERRAATATMLVEAWVSGHLVLPPCVETIRGERSRLAVVEGVRHRAWRWELQRFLDPAGAARLEEHVQQQRVAALHAVIGSLPPVPKDPGIRFHLIGDDAMVYARLTEGRARGVTLSRTDLVEALQAALDTDPGRLTDFALDFDGDQETLGQAVTGSPLSLEGDAFTVLLRHPDPGSLGQGAHREARVLRAGLWTLAALCALGGGLAFRMLRRERLLARLKVQFVASVSHELRTPLSSILLMAENLRDGHVPSETRRQEVHSSLCHEAERLRHLVDDVLDFSRAEKGEGPRLNREAVDLPAFFATLEQSTRRMVESGGGKLTVTVKVGARAVVLDPDAVQRAVGNLVENALHHSGARDVELHIGEEERGLRIAVRDFGVGIPVGARQRVRQAFHQGETNGGPPSGAGLGLAIVESIVHGHGGWVRIEDPAEGPGCVVTLTIPWGGEP